MLEVNRERLKKQGRQPLRQLPSSNIQNFEISPDLKNKYEYAFTQDTYRGSDLESDTDNELDSEVESDSYEYSRQNEGNPEFLGSSVVSLSDDNDEESESHSENDEEVNSANKTLADENADIRRQLEELKIKNSQLESSLNKRILDSKDMNTKISNLEDTVVKLTQSMKEHTLKSGTHEKEEIQATEKVDLPKIFDELLKNLEEKKTSSNRNTITDTSNKITNNDQSKATSTIQNDLDQQLMKRIESLLVEILEAQKQNRSTNKNESFPEREPYDNEHESKENLQYFNPFLLSGEMSTKLHYNEIQNTSYSDAINYLRALVVHSDCAYPQLTSHVAWISRALPIYEALLVTLHRKLYSENDIDPKFLLMNNLSEFTKDDKVSMVRNLQGLQDCVREIIIKLRKN